MEWVDMFLRTYNEAVAESCNNYINKYGIDAAYGFSPEAHAACIAEAEAMWEDKPLELEPDLIESPKVYINRIQNLDEVIMLFKAACSLCDDGIPGIIKEKLRSFGNEAEDMLLMIAADDKGSVETLEKAYSIRLLGEWKLSRLAGGLAAILASGRCEEQQLLEELEEALVNMGDATAIMNVLKESDQSTASYDYLVSALARIGKNNKDNSIYNSLKEYFLRSGKVILGASNLAVYGDFRAIPVLRGYAQKYMSKLSREEFYEIKSAVEALGGNMEDLAAGYLRM